MEKYCGYCSGWYGEKHFYHYRNGGLVCRFRKRRVVQARYATQRPGAIMAPTQPEGLKYCRYCGKAFSKDSDHWVVVDKRYLSCARHKVEVRRLETLRDRERKGHNPIRYPPYPDGYHWCGKCEGLYPLDHFEKSKMVNHGWYVCKRSRPSVKRREIKERSLS